MRVRMRNVSGNLAKAEMAAATGLFGTVGIVVHYIDLPSCVILMFRGIIGTLFLFLLIHLIGKRLSPEGIRANAPILIASGLFLCLDWLTLFEAYKSTTVSNVTLCSSLYPAFIMLLSPIFLKEKLTAARVACVLVALFGLSLISGVFDQEGVGASDAKGIVCAVASALFFTGSVFLNKRLKDLGPYDTSLVQIAVATVGVVVYSLVTVDIGSLAFDAVTVVLLFVLGIFHIAFAFTLYFGSMKKLNAQTVAIYAYVEPVVALVLSVAVLGEDPGVMGWAGATLILGSMLASELVGMRRSPRNGASA